MSQNENYGGRPSIPRSASSAAPPQENSGGAYGGRPSIPRSASNAAPPQENSGGAYGGRPNISRSASSAAQPQEGGSDSYGGRPSVGASGSGGVRRSVLSRASAGGGYDGDDDGVAPEQSNSNDSGQRQEERSEERTAYSRQSQGYSGGNQNGDNYQRRPKNDTKSDAGLGGYSSVMTSIRSDAGLPIKLNRLVDEIADFLKYGEEQVLKIKSKILENPDGWEEKLTTYYRENIAKSRNAAARSVSDVRSQNLDKTIMIKNEGGEIKAIVLDPERVSRGAPNLFIGAVFEKVVAGRTPFESPVVLFTRSGIDLNFESGNGGSSPRP